MTLRKLILVPIVGSILLHLAAGCGSTAVNPAATLARADSLTEAHHPDSALVVLTTLTGHRLSADERALHALITVKAGDKAFRTHTSDSTIRVALSRFGSHGPQLRRAETHYYHGRVLADLADYAGALDAFDVALSTLPAADTTRRALRLRSLILSQTAQLFEDLRLYDEAIPFYRSAIAYSKSLGDNTNAILDISSCIFCLMQVDSLNAAQSMLAEATPFLPSLSPEERAEIEISRRDLLLAQHNYTEAVSGIDTVLALIEPQFRNFGYRVAIDSYQALGIRDSVNKYIRLWLGSPSNQNKSKAYRLLTENAIADHDYQTADTMFQLYIAHTKERLVENSLVPVTVSQYVNRAYESESKVEGLKKRNNWLLIFLIVLIILIIVGTSLFLNVKFYKEINGMRLIASWLRSRQPLSDMVPPHPAPAPSPNLLGSAFQSLAGAALSEIRESLITTCVEHVDPAPAVHPTLEESLLRLTLRDMADRQKTIPDKSDIWCEIEKLILSVSPSFTQHLTILLGKYNEIRFRICMLIAMGFGASDIAVLLSKKLSGITYHRNRLCSEAFDNRVSLDRLPDAIRNLCNSYARNGD